MFRRAARILTAPRHRAAVNTAFGARQVARCRAKLTRAGTSFANEMPPSDEDNALSGDEDEEEPAAEEHVARVRPGVAKKALGRAAGSKRVKPHDLPIPINYQEMAGDTVGWQEYSLPDGTRLYNRLAFRYEEDFKTTGNVIAIRPPPPKAFSKCSHSCSKKRPIFFHSCSKLKSCELHFHSSSQQL